MAAHRYTPAMVERLRLLSKCGHGAAGIARHLQQRTDLPITPLSVRVKSSALDRRHTSPEGSQRGAHARQPGCVACAAGGSRPPRCQRRPSMPRAT